jgi:hypothetical protein
MTSMHKIPSVNPDSESPVEPTTRRRLLTGAGVVAAGVGLAGATSSVSAAVAPDDSGGSVGVAKPGVNAGEFISQILQSGSQGEQFTACGYLTQLAGAADGLLFAGTPRDVSMALLTTFTDGTLAARVVEGSMRALDVVGTLTIYQRSTPGADFSDPASFQVGTPVAKFALTLQDVLAVFAPGQGIPTLCGTMNQTYSAKLAGSGKRFGRNGMRARLSASGIGKLIDPVTLNAQLELAGNWMVEPS